VSKTEFAKYWKELEEKPTKPKPKVPRSETRDVVEAFNSSEAKYAELKPEFLKKYKSPNACARAMGRAISSLKLEEKLEVFAKENKVYLVKKE